MGMTVVLAVGPDSTGPQIECWIKHFRDTGTTLPVAVVSSQEINGLPADWSFHPVVIMAEDGPGKVDLTELVMVKAFAEVGPCLVLRPEALPVGPLDGIADIEGDFLMAPDPHKRKQMLVREEMASGAILTRTDISAKFAQWWGTSREMVSDGSDSMPGRFEAGNFGQMLLSMIYHEMQPLEAMIPIAASPREAKLLLDQTVASAQKRLPVEWCYSRLYEPDQAKVLWVHGEPGTELHRDWSADSRFYSDPS